MSSRFDESGRRRAIVTIPVIWFAFAVSLLIHGAALWKWFPDLRRTTAADVARAVAANRMRVQLMPRENASPQSSASVQPVPPQRVPPPPAAVPPQRKTAAVPPRRAAPQPPAIPTPAVVARAAPEAPVNLPPPEPTPAAAPPRDSAPARPVIQGDMLSMLQERRRARGESTSEPPPAEDERSRHNREVAENLGLNRPQAFGYDPRIGGGIFQIERIGFDSAEFLFYGWNKDVRRNTRQLIEVRRGNNNDTRIAVVRKMISIIREHEKGDFVWESRRLGRNLQLSARAADNAGLEEFLMQEFFEESRGRR